MRPDNRYEAHGLRPGVPLQMEVSMDEQVTTHATLLDRIEEGHITVLTPMSRLELSPLPHNAIARCSYPFDGRRMRFVSEVLGTSKNRKIQHLNLPAMIEPSERRRSFRLVTTLEPSALFQLVRTPGIEGFAALQRLSTFVDLSEGGVCLSTRVEIRAGDRLAIHLDLPGFGPVVSHMTVVATQSPEPGNLNYRVHCAFEDLDTRSRDRIARYVMHRQVELGGMVQA